MQSIPRDSNDKDVAAMLVELTVEANEESFYRPPTFGSNDMAARTIFWLIFFHQLENVIIIAGDSSSDVNRSNKTNYTLDKRRV